MDTDRERGIGVHATGGGGNLGPYLDLRATCGTMATSAVPSCTGFAADTTEYLPGAGNGVLYDGTLSELPSGWSSGIQHPGSAWTSGTAAVYRYCPEQPARTASSGTGSREWDVTEQVGTMYAGSHHGFVVRDASEGTLLAASQTFASREASSNPPTLVLSFG